MRGADLDLRRDPGGGIVGHGAATLAAGDLVAPLQLDAIQGEDGAATRLHATAAALNPAALARLLPGLAPLAMLDAALALDADVELGPALALRHARLHAESGPGQLFLPAKGGGASPANFASLALDADGNADALTLTALRLVLAPPSGAPPTTLLFSGAASRAAGHAAAHLRVTLDQAQMADLGALWPPRVGGGARGWLVENVVSGAVHDGRFDLAFEAPAALGEVALTAASGSMTADEVTLFWLRPIPPIEHARTVLTLLSPDALSLAATGGRQGNLVAQQASMRIWGISTKDQFGQIDADLAAPVADVFALLRHKRLKLLSVHPVPIGNPTGQSLTHLTVKLPLEHKVDFDSIGIHAASRLTDVRVPALLAGRDLDRGMLAVDVTQDGLALSGTARLAGIGSTLGVEMDFRGGAPDQVVQHVSVAARGDDRALAAAGLDAAGLLAGAVSANIDYAERRDGHAVLQGTADLRDAALSTPLGWSKPPGSAATLEARAALDHGRLTGIDRLRAEGPGLSVLGRGELVDGRPSVLRLDRVVVGRSSLAGTVTFPAQPGDPLQVALSGPCLDLAGVLGRKASPSPGPGPGPVGPGRSYRVDLRADRVLVSATSEGIGPVSLSASGDDRRIAQLRLVSSGPERVEATIAPDGATRRARATVGDLGRLLRAVGAGGNIEQGAFEMTGAFDDRKPGSPLAGTASLSQFGVHGVTVLGKLLQGLTLYGVLDALRGPGLAFDQLTSPFTLTGSVLDLRDARAYSSSLGVTAQGQVDFARATLNLQGTIVPAYALNTLPGRVPLIGRLLSPEAGGGLFAATFNLHGPLADPAIGVNPLATLAPGALRGLFDLFD